jgi:hypothetical protein
VTREGGLVATIQIQEEGRAVAVDVTVDGKSRPYDFATRESADAFLRDLATSFGYLGCELDHALRVSTDAGQLKFA